jgi:serine/threonine protein kinase
VSASKQVEHERSHIDQRYRLVERIGSGDSAVVYRAVDERLQREVAIKIFGPAAALDDRAPAAFEFMARVSNPGLVTVLDAGIDTELENDPRGYLVMEPVGGATLRALYECAALEPSAVAAIGSSVAASLAYLHGREVAHGGVTAANIMVPFVAELARDADPPPRCHTKLADLGVDRLLGSPPPSPADDIRSLGVALAEALTGAPITGAGQPLDIVQAFSAAGIDKHDGWLSLLQAMIDDDAPARPSAAAASAYLAAMAMTDSGSLFGGDDAARRRRPKPRHAKRSRRRWAALELGR